MASPSKSPNPAAAGASNSSAAPSASGTPAAAPAAATSQTSGDAPTTKPTTEEVPRFDNDPDVDMAPADGAAAAGGEEEELEIEGADKVMADGESNTAAGTGKGADSMNVDMPADEREARIAALQAQIEAAGQVPVRKDMSMREFLSKMDDYAPIIPDAVTAHALTLAGLPPPALGSGSLLSGSSTSKEGASGAGVAGTTPAAAPTTTTTGGGADPHATPLHLSRLLALATQKFIADIAADAYQYSRMRSGNLTSNTLSAVSNPGAASMGQMGDAPSGGGGGGGAGGGGQAQKGGSAADKNKQTGQHVLGVQRPGYGGGGQGGAAGRTVMTMEDLGASAANFGVSVKRSEFYR